MKHTKPYRHAVEKELKWLDEDIRIIDEELSKPEISSTAQGRDLQYRRSWAVNERARLCMWVDEAKEKGR